MCENDKGALRALTSDSVFVQLFEEAESLALPLDSVERLDVLRGRKAHTTGGVLLGAIVAGIGGGIIATLSYEEPEPCTEWCFFEGMWGAADDPFGTGFVVGAAIGGFVGGWIGSMMKTDKWEEVPLDRLQVSFAPQSDGRFAFGVSLSF